MNILSRHLASRRRHGMALLVVMVLTMLIALGAYRFSFYMESQYRVTRVHEEQTQARLAALSGVELAAAILEQSAVQRELFGSLQENPDWFRGVAIDGSPAESQLDRDANSWRFSLLSPLMASAGAAKPLPRLQSSAGSSTVEPSESLRFGLENESAKIHLPSLLQWDGQFPGHARMALLQLPGASEPLIDAWLRSLGVGEQRAAGGSGSARIERPSDQATLQDRQSTLDSLKFQWYGGDLNQNFRIDPLETGLAARLFSSDGMPTGTASNATGGLDTLGLRAAAAEQPAAWQRFLTWDSGQRNENRLGQPRIYLNNRDLVTLHRQLSEVWPVGWANFVIALRQYGPSRGGGTVGDSADVWTPDFGQAASFDLSSVLDLVGTSVAVPVSPSSPAATNAASSSGKQWLVSPFSSDLSDTSNYLDKLLDEATVVLTPSLTGRIDISQAPIEVLAAVPGLDLSLAQNIVQRRSDSTAAARVTMAWLLQEQLVDLQQLRSIEPYLTSRSDVYSVQAVGFRDAQSPVYRCTTVIDARQIPARIRNHQAWHAWGRGFSIASLGGADSVSP